MNLIILLSVAGTLYWTEPKSQALCASEAMATLIKVQQDNPSAEIKIACVPFNSVFKETKA